MDRATMDSLIARSGDVLHIGALPGPSHQPPPGIDPSWGHPDKAPVGLEKETGLELLEQNFLGTCGLFEAVARKRDGSRVVFASSLLSCGFAHDPNSFQPPQLPLDETQVTLPLDHYGFSKLAAENFAAMLVRTSGNAAQGGGDDSGCPTYVHLRFSNLIKRENWHTLPHSGKLVATPIMWTYVHEDDVLDAHLKALDLPADKFASRSETFYIIADDNRTELTTEELIKNHWAAKGVAPPELTRPLTGYASIASNEKAKKVLGWNPRTFRK
jgi:nucleoside-diphosphate-sugar epimerase